MDIRLFAKGFILMLVVALAGCGNDETPENTDVEFYPISMLREAIASGSVQDFEKENLPVWLKEYIDGLRPDKVRTVAAFRTKWKGEDVYYVYDDFFSCLGCYVFHSDGRAFDSEDKDTEGFWKSATGWEIVYLSKSGIHDL